MAFRSDDQDYRWLQPKHRPEQRHELARGDLSASLSLGDTARELAVTVAGFVGAILLITTVVRIFGG